MKRRDFLRNVSAGAAVLPLNSTLKRAGWQSSAVLLQQLISDNDKQIDTLLERQNRQPGHEHFGGIPDRFGIYHASTAASHARSLTVGYVSNHSRYAGDSDVAESLLLASQFLNRSQHEDGTIDLLTTNFHSTPDTAFVVEPLAIGLSCIQQHAAHQLVEVQAEIGRFLTRAGHALSRGGIHTPNHRWVVCMALAWINKFFPHTKFTRRIDQWLAEKIDIDPDGQYSEKSAAIYSPLVNRCLISVARLLARPQLYAPVRKNLDMTRYLLQPTGEVVTAASKRQDQDQVAGMHRYYYPYRYMALLDQNPIYSAMAETILDTCGTSSMANAAAYFLDDSTLNQELPPARALDQSYVKVLQHSQLVRIRRGNADITIVGDSDRFLTFQKGAATLTAMRLASAFFGKGQFVGDSINEEDGDWVLTQTLQGPYFQPLLAGQIPGDGDWAKMPRQLRAQSEIQTLKSTVRIQERSGRLSIQFDIRGTDHVPVAIELGFRETGRLIGVTPVQEMNRSYLLDRGRARYQSDSDTIEFGLGLTRHTWTQLRGALPKLDAHSVYITGFTPFSHTLNIQ